MKKKSLHTLKLNKKSISNLKNLSQLKAGNTGFVNTNADCLYTFAGHYLCDDDGGQLTEYDTTCGLHCGFRTYEVHTCADPRSKFGC